jgi:hypothetical protein
MNIGTRWTWQWGQGPTCHAGQPHKGAARLPCGLATSPIRGSCSRSNAKRWSKSVCTNGRDGVDADPLTHCHTVGRLQLTYQPTSYPNFNMCHLYNHHWEPTSAEDRKAVEWRAARCPLAPPDTQVTPSTSWLPTSTLSLYTINMGCGARWRVPHSIPSSPSFSKLSSLA